MASDEFYSTQTIRAKNPLKPVGLARMAVGFAYVFIALMVLSQNFDTLQALIETEGQNLVGSARVLTEILLSALAIIVLIWGLTSLSGGVGALGRLLIPPRTPEDLDSDELQSAFSRRELSAYSTEAGGSYGMVNYWFPQQFPLMTVRMKKVVARGLGEMTKFGLILFLIVAALILRELVPANAIGPLTIPLGHSAAILALPFFLGALMHAGIAIRMIPAMAPKVDLIEFRAAVRGGGDPSHISHGLLHELSAIRPQEGTPNREDVQGFAMEKGGVGDAGAFEGVLCVENQPAIEESAAQGSVRLLLIGAASLQVLALPLWFAPAAFMSMQFPLEPQGAVFLGAWLVQLASGFLVRGIGNRMFLSGYDILGTFRFRSHAVVLNVKGNYARSQVRVGKGKDDSIESENLVVRSDCSVLGFSALLLTESKGLSNPRSVVGMIIDERAREIEGMVRDWLFRFEGQGATIVGVDLKDEKLSSMVKANMMIEAQRTTARHEASARFDRHLTQGFGEPHKLSAGSKEVPSSSESRLNENGHAQGEWKACPECAEEIRAAATKCRFCGFRY